MNHHNDKGKRRKSCSIDTSMDAKGYLFGSCLKVEIQDQVSLNQESNLQMRGECRCEKVEGGEGWGRRREEEEERRR